LRQMPPAEAPHERATDPGGLYPRLDLPSKVDGSYLFAGDVRLPGMVYAAIRHGPIDRAELLPFDAAQAAGTPGLLNFVKGRRWIAAVASNWWAAEQALDRIRPQFRVVAPVESAEIDDALEQAITGGEAHRIVSRGEGADALGTPTYQ